MVQNAFTALTMLAGCQEEHPAVKIEWWGADMFVGLQQAANDLHMDKLMPQPPHHLLLH